jgi:hypothetical protein
MSGGEVSRRVLLGAAAALPLLPGHPGLGSGSSSPPPGRTTSWTLKQVQGDGKEIGGAWQKALARLRAAEAEVRAIERATAGGTAEEEEALEAVYMDRLGDHSAALLRLMKVRAPDLPALALKIELAIDREVGMLSGGGLCLALLKRDVRRLMR